MTRGGYLIFSGKYVFPTLAKPGTHLLFFFSFIIFRQFLATALSRIFFKQENLSHLYDVLGDRSGVES